MMLFFALMEDLEQWVAVAVAIFRDERVLALRRARDRDAGAGLWEVVSGRVRPGEEPLVAAAREVEEETGLEVELDERPVTAYAARRGDRPMIVVLYRAAYVRGELRVSAEHDEARWCTSDELARISTLDRLVTAVRAAAGLGARR